MARHPFGGDIAAWAASVGTGNVAVFEPGAVITMWNAETGGTQYTDLAGAADGSSPTTTVTSSNGGDGRTIGTIPQTYGPNNIVKMWASANGGPRMLMLATDTPDIAAAAAAGLDAHAALENPHGTDLANLGDVVIDTPTAGQTITWDAVAAKWKNAGNVAPWNIVVSVTANGATDAAPTIQAVLDALPASNHAYDIQVEPLTKGAPIYLNSKVRITTSNTRVRFGGPVLVGPLIDPDGFGGLSILGTITATTTVSSGATRGSSQIVVASTTNITPGRLIRIRDSDTTGGASAGNKSEMAEVVDVSGTTVYLDHALYHTYTGTITVEPVNPVTNSGFENINATFSGQQAAAFLFVCKAQYVKNCFFRGMHFEGTPSASWSRECFNFRYAYRSSAENCSASMGWNYAVGSTYDYGFSADGSTECVWTRCYVSNTRHAFTADKGCAGLIYTACTSNNTLASGFDLHGNWCRDIRYVGCLADTSLTRSAADLTRYGFLAGNTTFWNGCQNITYVGCVARNFVAFTASGGGIGNSAGFGIVDGCADINFQSCRVYDSQQGLVVLSQSGLAPITNVGLYDCEFSSITANPIYVNAGAAPGDVNGVVIDGCRFVKGDAMSSVLLRGALGNTIGDITVTNCVWNRSALVAGVPAIDARYVDQLVISNNIFNRTRRGVKLLQCVSAAIVLNVFKALQNATDATDTINDAGGNTGMVFARNVITGYMPTSWSVAINSSGAYVEFMSTQAAYTTSGRPLAAVARVGGQYFDTTLGKPVWSNGTAWVDAAGVVV